MLKKSRLPSHVIDAMELMTESSLGHGSRHGSVDLGEIMNKSLGSDDILQTSASTDSDTYIQQKTKKRNSMYDQFVEFNIDDLEISDVEK